MGGRSRNVSVHVSVTASVTMGTTIPADGAGNMEQSRISPASDWACRCRPWLPFLPADSSNVVKTTATSDAGQGSQTMKYSQIKSWSYASVSLNNFLKSVHFCFTETTNQKPVWLVHPHLFLALYDSECLNTCESLQKQMNSHRQNGSS